MSKQIVLIIRIFFVIASALALVLFLSLAKIGYIADSEIWSVTIAKNFGQEWFNSWVFTRPLFYVLLALATAIPSTALSIFLAAKVLFILIALAIVVLTFILAKQVVSRDTAISQAMPFLAVFLLLTNTTFMNQGYRIRSDGLACALVLFVLIYFLRRENHLRWRQMLLFPLPLLGTPKAVFQLPAFGVLIPTMQKKLMALGILVAAGVLGILVYPEGLTYLKATLMVPDSEPPYFSSERFIYVERSFANNALFWALFFQRMISFSVVYFTKSFRSERHQRRSIQFFAFTMVMFAIFLLAPEKVPFFLAAFIPVFSVFAAMIWEDIASLTHSKVGPAMIPLYKNAAGLCLVFIGGAIGFSGYAYWNTFMAENNWNTQVKNIEILDNFLAQYPKAEYFDAIGLVPQRATNRAFVGPNDPANNLLTLEKLVAKPPVFIFHVAKLNLLGESYYQFLAEKYLSVGGGIYARWAPLSQKGIKKEAINDLLAAESQALGIAPPLEFSALVSNGNKAEAALVIRTNLEEVWARKLKQKDFRILALTPVVPPPVPVEALGPVFNFDADY